MMEQAFGAPGRPPTWSSSDKDFVTTALGPARLWATIGHGVINEVFWPSTGEPQIRDLTFYLVGQGAFVDLKRERRYELRTPAPNVPLLTIAHSGSDYRLILEVVPDPLRDVLLIRFELEGPYQTGRDTRSSPGRDRHREHGLGRRVGAAWRNVAIARSPSSQTCRSFERAPASSGLRMAGRILRNTTSSSGPSRRADDGSVALTGQFDAAAGVMALGFADTTRRRAVARQGEPCRGYMLGSRLISRGLGGVGQDSPFTERIRAARQGSVAQRGGLEGARGPRLPRRAGRELEHPLGQQHGHARRLPPGVATRCDAWQRLPCWPPSRHGMRVRVLAGLISTQRPDGHWDAELLPEWGRVLDGRAAR